MSHGALQARMHVARHRYPYVLSTLLHGRPLRLHSTVPKQVHHPCLLVPTALHGGSLPSKTGLSAGGKDIAWACMQACSACYRLT